MKGISIIKRRCKVPNGMAYTTTFTGYCDVGYNFHNVINEVRRLSGIDPDIEYRENGYYASAQLTRIMKERKDERQRNNSEM